VVPGPRYRGIAFRYHRSASIPATHPVDVKLDAEIHAWVRQLAKARNCTPHHLMREVIAQCLEREDRSEAFRQEALSAWSAHPATGQHVNGTEADDWLAQLEAGQNVEPPECHN